VRAYERVSVRSRIRASLAEKKARGERVGTVPFGYRLSSDGVHIEPDEAEQAVVSTVRRLSAEGLSQRAIATQLAARSVAGRTGAPLRQTQVAKILRSAVNPSR
jgi:DNA invertase Pin-like site-specific DNA recombinase